MAATIDNGPNVPKLNRGYPVLVGTLVGTEHAVAFSLQMNQDFSSKSMVIAVSAGTVTTWSLDCSLDGGATWFVIPAASATVPAGYSLLGITGQITGDSAASFAASFNVSGFGGALFHFGVLTGTISSSPVWVLTD